MSVVFKRGCARIEANLTPMIDMTFLLIVFFVLVSHIVEVENVPMRLPEPEDPATLRPGDEQRAVVNVIPGPGGRAGGYRLGGRTYPAGEEGLRALTAQLAQMYSVNPRLDVNLRADRGTHYEHVEPVLQALSDAAASLGGVIVTPRINLVVVRGE
jgi:biopolymer transport protein ExbD